MRSTFRIITPAIMSLGHMRMFQLTRCVFCCAIFLDTLCSARQERRKYAVMFSCCLLSSRVSKTDRKKYKTFHLKNASRHHGSSPSSHPVHTMQLFSIDFPFISATQHMLRPSINLMPVRRKSIARWRGLDGPSEFTDFDYCTFRRDMTWRKKDW